MPQLSPPPAKNVPNWQKDGSASSTGDLTYTMNQNYDRILVDVIYTVANSGNDLSLQVDGITATNYNFRDYTGAETTGATSFPRLWRGIDDPGVGPTFELRKKQDLTAALKNHVAESDATVWWGDTSLLSNSQIDQFTLSPGSAEEITIDVYGRNVV